LLKNYFYPISLQKVQENESYAIIIRENQSARVVLLSLWNSLDSTPASMAYEKLKMKCFEAGLKPNLKVRTSVRQYTPYEGMYDTVVNVERVMKEKNEFHNEQRGKKRK